MNNRMSLNRIFYPAYPIVIFFSSLLAWNASGHGLARQDYLAPETENNLARAPAAAQRFSADSKRVGFFEEDDHPSCQETSEMPGAAVLGQSAASFSDAIK